MIKHLLIPLDGSRLAESALPVAAYLCERLGADVTLVHVIERNAPSEVHGDRHLRDAAAADRYLQEVARHAFAAGARVTYHVHTAEVGNVPRSIVQHAGEFQPDLIVLCSHGSGGLRDLLIGSIARQVIARGTTPVLLIRPSPSPSPQPVSFERILVPLDGNPAHEQSLDIGRQLAGALRATVHLVMVVPTRQTLSDERAAAGRLLPGAMSHLLDLAQRGAGDYLESHARELASAGIQVTTTVLRGAPADAIVRHARKIHAQLMILGTHGKSPTDAFWSGSVSPRILNRLTIPILLAPVRDDKEAGEQ